MKNNIVIIGGIHHNTLGVVRSLGEKKLSKNQLFVLLMAEKQTDSFIDRSKYLKRENVFYLPSKESVLTWLMEHAEGEKQVIICCSDSATEIVLSSRNMIEHDYYIPNVASKHLDIMSKCQQIEVAQQTGIRIPRSDIINNRDISNWNIFPCITKPIKSTMGNGKNDIYISNNIDELVKNLSYTKSKKILIQELIKKKMEYQLIGCSISGGEFVIIPGYTTIIRQPSNTNTGYLKYFSKESLNIDMKAVNDYIKKIGYSGLFSMEFIRNEKDEDYFLEINLRNDGNSYCVTSAGVNLPYLWVYYSIYNNLPRDEKLSFRKPVYFIPDFNDFSIGVENEGLLRWGYQFLTADSHSIFCIKDIKPFLFQLRWYIRHRKLKFKNNYN